MSRNEHSNGDGTDARRRGTAPTGTWYPLSTATGTDPCARGTVLRDLPPTHHYSFEVDHLVLISRGGSLYDRGNIDATHRVCNARRSKMSVDEVMAHVLAARDDAEARRPSPLTGPIETALDWWS